MHKKLKYILFLTALTVSNTAYAVGFVIDPAKLIQTWYETNHWAGITAAAIILAMIAATWKMPPIKNETKAVMVSDLFKLGRYVVILLLFVEYYTFLTSLLINLFDFFFG